MPSSPKSSIHEYQSILFGLFTVLCFTVTGWAIIDRQALVTILLLGLMTMYALGNTLPVVQRRIPRFDRLAAVPLGIIGAIAYARGAPTDLPIFFILLGVGSLIDLLWDPTGNVYGDNSE